MAGPPIVQPPATGNSEPVTNDPAPPNPHTYVALGDSISVDDYAGGPGRGGPSLLARNRDSDFPQWRGNDLASRFPGTRFRLLATDGATTDTLTQVQLPRLERLGSRPFLVTLTIGGNDLLSCYGDTPAARRAIARVRERVDKSLGSLAPLLAEAARGGLGTG